MPKTPKRVTERINSGIKKFRPILRDSKAKDINKTDTAVIVIDMMHEIFGFDKYQDITNDYFIKKSFCDLALYIDHIVSVLVEIKPIGLPLKEEYLRDVTKYASDNSIETVILTNGIDWNIYECVPYKPRQTQLLFQFNFLELIPKDKNSVELLYTISKEGLKKSIKIDFSEKKDALSRYTLGALILSDTVLENISKELKKLAPTNQFDEQDIHSILKYQVIKREVLENEAIKKAIQKIGKVNYKAENKSNTRSPIISPSKVDDKSINLSSLR